VGIVPTKLKIKNISPQRRGDAEDYFICGAYGATNKIKKFFSASPRLCGEKRFFTSSDQTI